MIQKSSRKQSSYASWIAAIVVVLAVLAAGIYLVRKAMQPSTSANTTTQLAAAASSAVNPASATSAAQHPIIQASSGPAPASTTPLPALSDSDASVQDALFGMAASGDLHALLVPHQIISRTVTTIDALPRHGLGSAYILPLRTPAGRMKTEQSRGSTVIAAQNAERYDPYMAVLESVDPHALVAWYKHNYPLFQQAYRELGYPHGYFNDRLIVAIDDMLAAPEPHAPVAVMPSGMHYVFVDPQWQALSNGQKLMVRLGPAKEAQFKAKLRMIRALLVGGQVAH